MRDRSVAEISTGRHTTLTSTHKTQTSMSPAGSEPAIPAIDQPQILALDRTTTGIFLRNDSVKLPSFAYSLIRCVKMFSKPKRVARNIGNKKVKNARKECVFLATQATWLTHSIITKLSYILCTDSDPASRIIQSLSVQTISLSVLYGQM